ncbi:MAG: hypothetical protein HYU98_06960 [Deltaproteobacteria bacterium]|nr:hypothetical protein [Deltaproteobacteria bacterium]
MKKILSVSLMLAVFFTFCIACAKSYKVGGVKYKVKEDKVIETSYGKKKIAKYFFKKPHVKKDKKIYVIGTVDVPGDSAPSRCEMAADLQAKLELAGELNSRFENQLQYAAEGFSIDASSLKQIASQSTKIDFIQGIYIDNRFWEKKLVRNGPDTYVKYSCYSRAAMPMKSFEQYADKILKEHEEKDKFSPEFQQKVDGAWNQFFNPVDVDDNKEYAIEYLENIQ